MLLKGDANLTTLANSVNGFRYLSFNNRCRPMNDCSFRQAVAVLIDKEFVTTTILQGVAFPVYGFVPQANAAWYNSDIITLGKGMSREERTNLAGEILKQAGYTWEGGVEPTWDPENRQVTPAGRLLMPDGTAVPPLVMPAASPGYDPLRSTFAIWIETWLNEFGIPLTAQLAGFNVIVPIIFTEPAFAPYKRIDIAIDAFERMGLPLILIGGGQEEGHLRKMAKKHVHCIGWQSRESLREYYRGCKALIFPGEEDFGIVPLEAQACGKPVIAFAKGGVLETVHVIYSLSHDSPAGKTLLHPESPTGVFFTKQTPESLIEAVQFFECHTNLFDSHLLRKHAEGFDRLLFKEKFKQYIEKQVC